MRKASFLLVLILLVSLFALGCNTGANQSNESSVEKELPTYEELLAINTYDAILNSHENFYVKNEWVDVVAGTSNVQELVFMKNDGKIEYHEQASIVGEEGYVSKVSRIGGEWYYYAINDPYMFTPYYSALEIDCQFFDYCLPELMYGEPVGRAYIEDGYIVQHVSYIQQATEDIVAKRNDLTYYFNVETKLIERIYELEYDNTNSVVVTYDAEFIYDVKVEDYFSQPLIDEIYNNEKRIDIEVVVGSDVEQKTYSFVATTDSQHVVVIENMPYDLYTDVECTDLVESLAEFEGQKSITLYSKVRFTEE